MSLSFDELFIDVLSVVVVVVVVSTDDELAIEPLLYVELFVVSIGVVTLDGVVTVCVSDVYVVLLFAVGVSTGMPLSYVVV